jgi:hypothetical protein
MLVMAQIHWISLTENLGHWYGRSTRKNMKHIEEMTFDELVDHASRQTHDGLLTHGGNGLKDQVHLALCNAIGWAKSQEKKSQEKKKK